MSTATATESGLPDMKVSIRQLFGIDSDLEVPAYSEPGEHVPEIDSDYRFDKPTMVIEAPDARVGSVVVVERSVLHHQEDHVFDRSEIRACRCGPRQGGHRWRRGAPSASGRQKSDTGCNPRCEELAAGQSPLRRARRVLGM